VYYCTILAVEIGEKVPSTLLAAFLSSCVYKKTKKIFKQQQIIQKTIFCFIAYNKNIQ